MTGGTLVPFTAPDSAVFDWFGVTPGYSQYWYCIGEKPRQWKCPGFPPP
jgi:hypothetical protein